MSIFNAWIIKAIAEKTPLLLGKIGWTEGLMLRRRLELGYTHWWDQSLHVNAGVYPLGAWHCERWANIYIEALGALDGAAQWYKNDEDKELFARYAPQAYVEKADADDLLPLKEGSWIYHVAGKRLLVIHPQRDTILQQVARFEKVWPGASIGPVTIIKAPYPPALGGRAHHPSWFSALNYMKQQVMEHGEYDYAILGCGAYGLPLGKFIKETCKIPVLHLGGKSQLFFGICGKRWDKFDINWRRENLYDANEFWTRPLPQDRPFGAHLCDHGCYW